MRFAPTLAALSCLVLAGALTPVDAEEAGASPAAAAGAGGLPGALPAAPPTAAVAPAPAPAPPAVFVLGVDGLDPVILGRLMDEGRMPHFARMASEGTLQELGTSNPPQSPVAWSNFVTGMNPGGHGIYDFIHRDPASYMPRSSATRPSEQDDEPYVLEIFGYILPLGGTEPANNRSGKPFWDILTEAGVQVEVFRMPGNYPPSESDAFTLSGMGTVDLRGELGKYTWYTDEPLFATRELKADVTQVVVEDEDLDGVPDTVHSRLKGPPDFLHLRPGQLPGADDFLSVDLTAHVDAVQDVVWLKVGRAQAVLRQGEWSDWLELGFEALPWGMLTLQGNARFYMKEVRPVFRLYASPVNIAPNAPAQPVTTPDDASQELFEALGHFYTQGMPEETNALKDGLFDDDDYIRQVALVHEDGNRMLDFALKRLEPGDLSFMYLSDVDLQCHMLWRHGDPKHAGAPHHPAFEPLAAAKHAYDIERFYANVDATLGGVAAAVPTGTLLIVMSDHGFQPYTRQVHLNAWLRDEGYLVLRDGMASGHVPADVDWSRTRAYGLGFNGLYLNRAGREQQGIVQPGQAAALAEEIRSRLLALTDPADGRRAVKRVDLAAEAYSGKRLAEAPDLVVGYDRGFGCSDDSTLGGVPEAVFEDNTSRWSGNHLMAPEVVPGILLVNRKLPTNGHDLTDVTATLLDHFGLEPAPGMVGHSFLPH